MGKFINKIKQFFKNIIFGNKTKRLEAPKEITPIENDVLNNQTKSEVKNQEEKKDFFEIYNKVKNGQYDLQDLTEQQSKKIITILKSEISLKKDKLDNNITELNILKVDNRINEKNRILELYNEVKNETIDLADIDKEDLLKIRKLLLEESKMQDERFEDEINSLDNEKDIYIIKKPIKRLTINCQ